MTTIYNLNGLTLKDAAKHVCRFLENNEKMETQCLTSFNDEYIIQGRATHCKSRKLIGLDKAVVIKINPIGDSYFSVEIGEGKWVDKGIALAMAWFFFWPLAVTSGVGIYNQKTLPSKILKEIDKVFTAESKIS